MAVFLRYRSYTKRFHQWKKANQRRKFLDFLMCQSNRTLRSTNVSFGFEPFLIAPPYCFANLLLLFQQLLFRFVVFLRLLLKSKVNEWLHTFRNLCAKRWLCNQFHQNDASIPHILDWQ